MKFYQIINKVDVKYTKFKEFLDWCKTFCGSCGVTSDKLGTWKIQNLISKPEFNGKMCERLETLDNGRIKIKIENLQLSVKPECLLHYNKCELLTCGRCKVIKYCNGVCQKRHWKEGGHKQECV